MDEIYFAVRAINLVWGSILFVLLIYYGIIDLMLSRQCSKTHIPPEMRFWATGCLAGVFVLLFSLVEIFLIEVGGGLRTFTPMIFLLPITFGLRLGASRVNMHKVSVAQGKCQ